MKRVGGGRTATPHGLCPSRAERGWATAAGCVPGCVALGGGQAPNDHEHVRMSRRMPTRGPDSMRLRRHLAKGGAAAAGAAAATTSAGRKQVKLPLLGLPAQQPQPPPGSCGRR
jgi:hypothetical protein